MFISIVPMGKPRQTQSDRWKQRPVVMRYRAFADELRLKHSQALPVRVRLVFWLPMPPSWSNKKREEMNHAPHQQKPDVDNLAKSVLDALLKDDSAVWQLQLEKYWSDEPGIDIDVI